MFSTDNVILTFEIQEYLWVYPKYTIHLFVNITSLLSNDANGMAVWLNNVCKILHFDHIRHGDCKIEYSKHFKRFLTALVIATCGYYGNRRTKVDVISQTVLN